jgi:hypothetical protein
MAAEEEWRPPQWNKDDIISTKILEHQDELLDEKYYPIIRNAMMRIPYDVVDTIGDERNVRFTIINEQDYAFTKNLLDPYGAFPPEQRGDMPSVNWQVIVINDRTMNKLNSEDKQAVVAHELAHVYLEHGVGGPSNDKKTHKEMEQEANYLIRSWGFKPTIKPLKPETRNTTRRLRANERKLHDKTSATRKTKK